jgi:hypothetical protein
VGQNKYRPISNSDGEQRRKHALGIPRSKVEDNIKTGVWDRPTDCED